MGEAFITRRGGGGGGIKSIQHGIISTAYQSDTVTISSVNPQNSVVLIEQYYPINVSYPFKLFYMAGVANETTISFSRHSGLDNSYIRWTVIEFENVKSKQTGTTLVPPDGRNVAISEVNISKSMLVCSAQASSTNQKIDEMFFRSYLSSSTNIKFERDAEGYYGIHVRWQLIEFN